ncbi:MAG: UvrD-helicase domain-containing protein [Planctomycetes bacterium]|nr:UvrD-helicase domain-containing protein [Planctomycetota bacterium]
MNLRPQVILASAGSGKTWQLTTHLLGLLASGVPPERILASTFTRKAAGEILGRVFARLAAAAADDEERKRLDAALGRPATREAYRGLLASLVRDVQRFRVRTLDSFFVELAQAFAPELGLAPDWRIADEVEASRAHAAALGRALESGSASDWVLLLRELERNQHARSVRDTLLQVVAEAHGVARESQPEAWQRVRGPAAMSAEQLVQARAFLEECAVPRTKDGAPRKLWVDALARTRDALEREAWDTLFHAGLGEKVLAGEPKFGGVEIAEELRELYLDLARHAAAHHARVIDHQNRATRRWLEAYELEYQRAQRERGWVQFGDLPHLLAAGGNADARPTLDEIALRIDARLDHLLLDEFQDTSPAQWRVLAPLADELVADGTGTRSFFCVGDAKQSIYGWRAADPRLFEDLPRRYSIRASTRATSFRSAQVVLDAVNAVFGRLAERAPFEKSPTDRECAEEFQRSFEPHLAAKSELRGAVRVHTCASGESDGEHHANAIRKTVELVREIRAAAPRASIAVLLRRNALAARIAKQLGDAGIAASAEGGNPLTDAVAVQAALALLQWIEHPGDSVARFHASSSLVGRELGLSAASSEREVGEELSRLRTLLADSGPAEFLALARTAVERELGPFEARRYGQLIDAALAWRRDGVLRSGEFLERVRNLEVEDPSAAYVKVMTIHASKGLEFDAVILPELDVNFVRDGNALWWRRADGDPTREIECATRSASADIRALLARSGHGLLDALHASHRARALRDGLSALYVAMTRARHRLDLVLWPKMRLRFTPGALVRSAFGLDEGELEPDRVQHVAERSDDGWPAQLSSSAIPASALGASRPLVLARTRRPRELEREQPSKIDPPRRIATVDLFRAKDELALRRGSRFHVWIEAIEWLEGVASTRAQLSERAERAGLGGARLEEDLSEFLAALEAPGLRALLARPGHDAVAWRERRFRLVVGDKLESGAFDRVVLRGAEQGWRTAQLVDFKTDRWGGREERLRELRADYALQLAAYRRALERITGLESSAITTLLYFFDGDRVVEVQP